MTSGDGVDAAKAARAAAKAAKKEARRLREINDPELQAARTTHYALPPPETVIMDKIGRPTDYSIELQEMICSHVIAGMSLVRICALHDMPAVETIVRWLRIHPIFAQAYAHAREAQADTFADEIMAIADDRSADWVQDPETGQWKPDHDNINRAKLRVDARKWIAAKLKPQKYGERVEAKLSGTVKVEHTHAVIDARALSPEAREALRAGVLAAMQPALEHSPEDDDA